SQKGLFFTREQAEAAEGVDVAFAKVKGVFAALIREVANKDTLNALADVLERVAQILADPKVQDAARTLGTSIAELLGKIAQPDNVDLFAKGITTVADAFKDVGVELDRIKQN